MRLILLALLLTLSYHSAVSGQIVLERQKVYADSLFANRKFFDAVTEYKRLIFFDTDSLFQYESAMQIGYSYKAGGFTANALRYFTLAEMSAESNERRNDALLEKAKIYMLRRSTAAALNTIEQLEQDYHLDTSTAAYWRGWTYLFNDEWDKAANEFATVDTAAFLKNFCNTVHQNKYSVSFAVAMSYIIPGAGQIYTGNYLSGLLSLAWSALWGYFTVKAFIDERIFDGIATGNFLFLRFYRGNIQNAGKFAEEKNRLITNDALRYLQFKFEGQKP